MKHLARAIIAVLMAVLMAALLPAQVFADTPEYISEVKVGIGSYKELESDGYTILKNDKGNAIDLNTDAGGGTGSKGDKAVYLGYKTTNNRSDAITDLALMNMKGGYSVQEYEALMETQMKSQIIPFVESFLVTINEYRANYASDNESNQARAQYVHDLLNKLRDDDCGGEGLGDLLLNETKYEMGDEAYNALSDEEKKQHADILTIIAQASGQATLLMNNLLTRAADTDDDTWIDRFSGITYDDLLDVTPGKTATDKNKALAKLYDDDASDLINSWNDLKEELEEYDEAYAAAENDEAYDYEALEEKYEDFDLSTASTDEIVEALEDMSEERYETTETSKNLSTIAVHDYLESIEYNDGTLLDFFMQEQEDVEDDITVLYPLIASLSDGQKAGLEYISLKELILATIPESEQYEDIDTENADVVSIYAGVDRGIYEKGGVALTSDALREEAALQEEQENPGLSTLTKIMIGVSAFSAVAAVGSMIATGVIYAKTAETITTFTQSMEALKTSIAANQATLNQLGNMINSSKYLTGGQTIYEVNTAAQKIVSQFEPTINIPDNVAAATQEFMTVRNSIEQGQAAMSNLEQNYQAALAQRAMASKLMVGLTVAMVVITAITVYLTWKDMHDFYNVDFTPIPRYMVDEKDLIGYNKKGERIILKNQSAYYKAVESNMKSGDFKFDEIGNLADMNGCVGQQWLALYAAKNEAEEPILANSFKVVIGSNEIPANYETGIHMFGANTAFNLNDSHYDWNDDADSVYVYFQRDEAAASTAGTNFSGGTLALSAGGGLLLGAAVTALGMTASRKRKETAKQPA